MSTITIQHFTKSTVPAGMLSRNGGSKTEWVLQSFRFTDLPNEVQFLFHNDTVTDGALPDSVESIISQNNDILAFALDLARNNINADIRGRLTSDKLNKTFDRADYGITFNISKTQIPGNESVFISPDSDPNYFIIQSMDKFPANEVTMTIKVSKNSNPSDIVSEIMTKLLA